MGSIATTTAIVWHTPQVATFSAHRPSNRLSGARAPCLYSALAAVRGWHLLKSMISRAGALVVTLGLSQAALAADLPSAAAPPPPVFTQTSPSFLSGWEARGGLFGSTWGP